MHYRYLKENIIQVARLIPVPFCITIIPFNFGTERSCLYSNLQWRSMPVFLRMLRLCKYNAIMFASSLVTVTSCMLIRIFCNLEWIFTELLVEAITCMWYTFDIYTCVRTFSEQNITAERTVDIVSNAPRCVLLFNAMMGVVDSMIAY